LDMSLRGKEAGL